MLSERERRGLLARLLEATDELLAARTSQHAPAMAEAFAKASACRSELNDGYVCEMSLRFDEVYGCLSAAADASASDAHFRSLQDAVDRARGQVLGAIASGSRAVVAHCGGGVRRVVAGDPARELLEVEVRILRDRFGADLVGGVLRLMAGGNRIAALLHFIKLNSTHVVRDSVAFERNFHFAALMTFAYLKELSRVLDDLSAAGIKGNLTDAAPWTELHRLRRRWEGGIRRTLRDNVVFHLGWRDEAGAEVEKWATDGERVALLELDHERTGMDFRYSAGESLLMSACGLTLADYRSIISDGVEAYSPLFLSIARLVDDLLRQCGARLPDLVGQETELL
jgi:ribosome modulation factor